MNHAEPASKAADPARIERLREHYSSLSDKELANNHARGRGGFTSDVAWDLVVEEFERRELGGTKVDDAAKRRQARMDEVTELTSEEKEPILPAGPLGAKIGWLVGGGVFLAWMALQLAAGFLLGAIWNGLICALLMGVGSFVGGAIHKQMRRAATNNLVPSTTIRRRD